MKATPIVSKSRKRNRSNTNNNKTLSTTLLHAPCNGGQDQPSNLLWVEKYKPQRVDQLVVTPKRINEIRQWLLSFSPLSNETRLLVLTGGPGVGKSTTVQLLAKELGLELLQWSPHNQNYNINSIRDRQPESSKDILGSSICYDDGDSNQFSSLSDFLQSASLGYTSVLVERGHQSNKIESSRHYINFKSTDNYISSTRASAHLKSTNNSSVDDILSDDDNNNNSIPVRRSHPKSHRDSTKPTLHIDLPPNPSSDRQTLKYSSIILLEELPTLNTVDREEQFRQLISNYISITQVPIILVFSDVYEGKYRPEDLERILDRHVLYSSAVRIIEVNPVTKTRMKKCLDHIVQAEGAMPRGISRSRKSNSGGLDLTWIEEIHSCTGGDLRQAIMTLQFLHCGKNNNSTQYREKKSLDHHHHHQRDVTLSSFHALGKLLYAKRKDVSSNASLMIVGKDHRPPLDFDPEKVMEGSSMGLHGSMTFLEYHSPDFFTDIIELSEAMETFSDSAFFIDKVFTGLGEAMSGYASSFASRAVACANKHAAPSKFRQFTSPQYFTVVRKREGNKVKMSQLLRRLSQCDGHLLMDVNLSSSSQFFVESLSLLHRILPLDTPVIHSQANGSILNHDELDYTAAIKYQNEVLALDDIVESDGDNQG